MAIVLSWQGDVPSAVIVSEGQASTPESTAETVEPVPGASTGPEVLRPGLKETDVSPGLVGFLAIFAVAVAVTGLFLLLSRQIRRVTHSSGHETKVTAVFDGPAPTRGKRTSPPSQSGDDTSATP